MPKKQKEPQNIAQTVSRAIKEEIEKTGCTLWDVEYVKEGSERYLRITIDRPGGVDLDACENVMRLVDPIITELDPIEEQYHLEVSSPGLERVLRTDDHFTAFIGERICVKLFTPIEGKKEWTGVLSAYDGGVLTLVSDEKTVGIERKRISRANVCFDFDSIDCADGENSDAEEDHKDS